MSVGVQRALVAMRIVDNRIHDALLFLIFDFDVQLEQTCTDKLPPFPPKKYFGNTKPTFIASRRIALEKYLQDVCDTDSY